MSTYILGISALYHDSAACLLKDGEIIAAAHEERFTRKKHDESFPVHAIAYCLDEAGVTIDQVDFLSFYEKPIVKFDRILQTAIQAAPWGLRPFMMALPIWLKERLWMHGVIKDHLPEFTGQLLFPTHHESHAASAFFASPFESAAVLTLDAVGEWNTTTYGTGKGNVISVQQSIDFPHSLGMLYSAVTYYCGFKVNSGEYKLMGLAPYGEPKYVDTIKAHLIDIKADGSFRLNMKYFGYVDSLYMTNARFHALFGHEPLSPDATPEQFHMDMAASIQKVTEEIVLLIAAHVQKETGARHLCLAGGVSLNCVANGKLQRAGIFDSIWIQPASGDAGGALGAALFAWHMHLGQPRTADGVTDKMRGAYLGPAFSDDEIEAVLVAEGAVYEKLTSERLIEQVAELITKEKVVGWFQGRMEYGPRALGGRSILGDARSQEMQQTMNLKIKFRESFRPFAPSIMEEAVTDYFEEGTISPYMLLTFDVLPQHRLETAAGVRGLEQLAQIRSTVPAITHVDYSARVQTVSKETNPRYHALLATLQKSQACPIVINTSFNVRGEPIVCSPTDAWHCFVNTNMDNLAIGNFLVTKQAQKTPEQMSAWTSHFAAD